MEPRIRARSSVGGAWRRRRSSQRSSSLQCLTEIRGTRVPSGGPRMIEGQVRRPCDEEYDRRFMKHVSDALTLLGTTGAKVAVTTIPYWGERRTWRTDAEVDCANEDIAAAVASNPTARLIDLARYICPGHQCIDRIDGVLLRPDELHFN